MWMPLIKRENVVAWLDRYTGFGAIMDVYIPGVDDLNAEAFARAYLELLDHVPVREENGELVVDK